VSYQISSSHQSVIRARRAGFTLMELIVSVAVLAILSVYLADMFARQSRAYAVVDDVTEAQQSLRAISHMIEREVRTTGFMVPEAAALCGTDNTNTSDILFVSDGDPLVTGTTNMLGATVDSGFGGGGGTDNISLNSVVVDGNAFYDPNETGVADSDFQENGGVIVVDRNNPARGSSCGVVTGVNTAANTISVDFTIGGQPLAGAAGPEDLVAVPAHVYQVNANSQLVRDGMILADGVEDLQFSAFFDRNDNDTIEVNLEYFGHEAGPAYVSGQRDNSELREVRVSFVVRTRLPDPDFNTGEFQPTENRVAPAGNDGFRRRVYTTIVRPRNVGMRRGI